MSCTVSGCDKKRRYAQWCKMHYTRWIRYGSLEKPRRKYVMPEVKFCKKCLHPKPVSEFPLANRCQTLSSYCKRCSMDASNRSSHKAAMELNDAYVRKALRLTGILNPTTEIICAKREQLSIAREIRKVVGTVVAQNPQRNRNYGRTETVSKLYCRSRLARRNEGSRSRGGRKGVRAD